VGYFDYWHPEINVLARPFLPICAYGFQRAFPNAQLRRSLIAIPDRVGTLEGTDQVNGQIGKRRSTRSRMIRAIKIIREAAMALAGGSQGHFLFHGGSFLLWRERPYRHT
jgi:hypothetical protein